MSNQRIKDSVDALTGGPAADDAIVAQERAQWALAGALLTGVVMGFVARALTESAILVGGLIGGSAGLALAVGTTYWVIARVGDHVLVCSSPRWAPKAAAIEQRLAAPVDYEVTSGLITHRVDVAAKQVRVPRQLLERLRTILG